jgi:thioredoxin-like negative regulator of GroEL
VSIKCLLLIGSQTPYEQILGKRGEEAVRQAAAKLDARTEVARLHARHWHEIEELEAQAEHEARQARLRGNHAVTSDLEWWR